MRLKPPPPYREGAAHFTGAYKATKGGCKCRGSFQWSDQQSWGFAMGSCYSRLPLQRMPSSVVIYVPDCHAQLRAAPQEQQQKRQLHLPGQLLQVLLCRHREIKHQLAAVDLLKAGNLFLLL